MSIINGIKKIGLMSKLSVTFPNLLIVLKIYAIMFDGVSKL